MPAVGSSRCVPQNTPRKRGAPETRRWQAEGSPRNWAKSCVHGRTRCVPTWWNEGTFANTKPVEGEMKGQRCLVTGGAGFIGSHTVDLLLQRGYDVRILDDLQDRVHPTGRPSWVSKDAQFLQGDV